MRFRLIMPFLALVAGLQSALLPGAGAGNSTSGLRTEFGEVRLPKLAIGKSYSVWRLAETALVLRNTGDAAMDVRVDILVPSHHDLRPGAQPLPDPLWVGLERTRLLLPARSVTRTDVRVTLPYDPDLAGKTFQVDLRTSTMDETGHRTSGQVHRLLFTVAMDYRDDTEAQFSSRTFAR